MTLTCSTRDIVHSEGGSVRSMIFSVQKREYLRLEDIQLYDADIVEMNEPKTYVTEKELGHYGFTNTMPDNFHYVRYCI